MTNELYTKSKIRIDLGDELKVSLKERENECTKLNKSRMLSENITK